MGDVMIANVLVEIKKIDKTFSYLIPDNMNVKVGIRCLVPFGDRKLEGFIVEIKDNIECDYQLKEIISLIDDNPVLNGELLDLGSYISKKTLCTLTSAYQTMLPTALKAKTNKKIKKKYVYYIRKIKEYEPKNQNEEILFNMLNNKDISLKEASQISKYAVDKLLKNNIIEKYEKEVYRLNNEVYEYEKEKELTLEQSTVID